MVAPKPGLDAAGVGWLEEPEQSAPSRAPRSEPHRRGVPFGGLLGPDSDLERTTRACLHNLRTVNKMACKDLIGIVDQNSAACEELGNHWEARDKELRTLMRKSRKELDAGGGALAEYPGGIFSDILYTLGLDQELLSQGPTAVPSVSSSAAATGPSSPMSPIATYQVVPGTGPRSLDMMQEPTAETGGGGVAPAKSLRVDLDASLEQLEIGLPLALRQGQRWSSELQDLGKRLEKLKACWPCLREAILRAYTAAEPLETASLAWTLREVLSWRRSLASALHGADAACAQLQDGLERSCSGRQERHRWKTMARDVLGSLDQTVAARAAAVLWLRRSAGALSALGEASEVLERNLEVVSVLERRLVKCAGAVMRNESERHVVRRAVRRLSNMRGRLMEVYDEVSALRKAMNNAMNNAISEVPAEGLLEAVDQALRRLLEVIDEVGDTFSGDGPEEPPCEPLPGLESLLAAGLSWEEGDEKDLTDELDRQDDDNEAEDTPEVESFWKVLDGASVRVRQEKSLTSETIGVKHSREVVKGRLEGDWVKLDTGGYMLTQNEGVVLLREQAAPSRRQSGNSVGALLAPALLPAPVRPRDSPWARRMEDDEDVDSFRAWIRSALLRRSDSDKSGSDADGGSSDDQESS